MLKSTIHESIFDLSVRILNYSIEFAKTGGYASLRFIDILSGLMDIVIQLEDNQRRQFYLRVKNEIEKRDLLAYGEERAKFLDDMLDMFINEWRMTA